jgi:hypothetical protein
MTCSSVFAITCLCTCLCARSRRYVRFLALNGPSTFAGQCLLTGAANLRMVSVNERSIHPTHVDGVYVDVEAILK